jgi:hypothetical protein
MRKSEAAVRHAQCKLTREQQDGKGKVSPEKREFACYVLLFKSCPRTSHDRTGLRVLSSPVADRTDLQTLKSIVQLGHVPKHDDQSSRAWLYGTLFVALLSRKLARLGSAISPWGYYLPEHTTAKHSLVALPVCPSSSD